MRVGNERPMEKQDIHAILDSLDIQIAMGKIDQITYNTLKQKWLQMLENQSLAEASGNLAQSPIIAPLTSPSTPLTQEQKQPTTIEVLACPRCGAPANISNVSRDLSQPIQCLFCDTVYTLHQGQDNTRKLKQELKAWLDQMIVSNGYAGNSIDVNARRFIFSESLYPTLKKDIDRRIETFENIAEAPIVQVRETLTLPGYQPDPRLIALAQGDNQWLKTLSTRVSAQQLQDFAIAPDDKRKLQQLQLRILNLIYYANIAQHLATPGVTSYHVVRQNVIALQKVCQESIEDIVDEHYRSYLTTLDARMSGNIQLLDLIISTLGREQNDVPETMLAQVDQAINQLEKACQLALTCTYNPLYTVPLQLGIQKDIVSARIFQAIVRCYEVVTRTRSEEFGSFYKQLISYIYGLTRIETADHLLWLLISAGRVLMARTGDAPIPILMDWSWLQTAVESHRRTSTFGFSSETGQVIRQHFHPYWAAKLHYTEVNGILDKQGSVREGLLLIDATSPNASIVVPLLSNTPALMTLQAALHNFNLLDKQVVSLPALLTKTMAERAMKAYTNQHQSELKVTTVRTIGVIYLPAAAIQYTSKKGSRALIVSWLNGINQKLDNLLVQTQQFLQKYDI